MAKQVIERAIDKIGGSMISLSAGNPTLLTGAEIVELLEQTAPEPVAIMVDDCGDPGIGWGERAMKVILGHPKVEVLGIVAVASNTSVGRGCRVDFSIDARGEKIFQGVDKHGKPKDKPIISGDTVHILDDVSVPVIVGIGDPGKMRLDDGKENSIQVMTLAFEEILKKNDLQDE